MKSTERDFACSGGGLTSRDHCSLRGCGRSGGRGANQREVRDRERWQSIELGKIHTDSGGYERETAFSFSFALTKESLKEEILESECLGMLLDAS